MKALLPNISLFHTFVLLTICAILIWANMHVRLVSQEIHSGIFDGDIESYGCGWPFMMTWYFNETDARNRRGDLQNWQAKETAGNVAVALAILAATFVALRLVNKAYSNTHPNQAIKK